MKLSNAQETLIVVPFVLAGLLVLVELLQVFGIVKPKMNSRITGLLILLAILVVLYIIITES